MDLDAEYESFRDFRIGTIQGFTEDMASAQVAFCVHHLSEKPGGRAVLDQVMDIPLRHLTRCHLLPETTFTLHNHPGVTGEILVACADTLEEGAFASYYALIQGTVQQVSEVDITQFSSTRQDSDPLAQALSYELQHPKWRQPRDQVVTFAGELKSTTYGIEDLVGSRVLLLAHQAEVVSRALSAPTCRLMLADEVGLGKTIEAAVILRALRRRNPAMKALIVAPSALTGQWRNELNQKFWLDVPILKPGGGGVDLALHPAVMISAEDLATYDIYWDHLKRRDWDLLIIDEAHHLRKNRLLYDRVLHLSTQATRVLALTATPIQRRAEEYLDLLRLLDPRRYTAEDQQSFQNLVAAQEQVRTALALVRPQLNATTFDWEEFSEDLASLLARLSDDAGLRSLTDLLTQQEHDHQEALETAKQIAAYISTNYRIENRMVRNRRASLQLELPTRTCDTSYSYDPGEHERELLEDLYEYLGAYLAQTAGTALELELARVCLHSAASSPQALLKVLHWRIAALREGLAKSANSATLTTLTSPRREQARIKQLAQTAPPMRDELAQLEQLIRRTELWLEESAQLLAGVRRATANIAQHDRLVQALRAIYAACEARQDAKIVVFSSWPQTIDAIQQHLIRLLGSAIAVRFTAEMDEANLQLAADRFQRDQNCCVLLCDELGGEGRNFQIAQQIIHIDLPWTPAQIEQRIGRVDRLGRTGEVCSLPIVARDTLEHDLFRLWNEALNLFTYSLSGMEIALEEIQDQLVDALRTSVRTGLSGMHQSLANYASQLRQEVERERYFEEDAINQRRRYEFEQISKRYRDGEIVRKAVQNWTAIAGVSSYHMDGVEMIYDAQRFNLNSMINARFLPPNMEEAARRSGRQRTTQIRGTFNRDLAIRREDLVFFAPGDDPWTDAVIANALECDRGRCCAIGFMPQPGVTVPFFDLFYTFQINPRPLYAAGLAPIYMLQALGYLACTHKRILIDAYSGNVIDRFDPRWKFAEKSFDQVVAIHLGRRSDDKRRGSAQLGNFQACYPHDIWADLVTGAVNAATQFLDDDLNAYTEELAEEAANELRLHANGWEAGLRWHTSYGLESATEHAELAVFREAIDLILKGIRRPLRRLESICFYSPMETAS
ncbi:SNF2-related protein [Candidatus Viridilinea mediisalina]|nr:SNF2-related protein [Candidatus Viridilinea mediisalina]